MSSSPRRRIARQLGRYTRGSYHPGKSRLLQGMWYIASLLLFESGWFPLTGVKSIVLRLFGARIGVGVVIKPNVRIKYPWRLSIGDHSWVGQEVWIDNLANVEIGANTCLSQGVYLCSGSHDHQSEEFDLITRPIVIGDCVWIAAKATVLPGVCVGRMAVVCAGSVVTEDIPDETMVGGVPARRVNQKVK